MLTTCLLLCGTSTMSASPEIRGDYVEARTADVFTGPCFSNAEVFISGDHAVMAWKITEGRFAGQDLAGLSVVAAVEGNTTFSKDDVASARSTLILDRRATPAQREALTALAKELSLGRLGKVEEVQTARIDLTVENHDAGSASGSAEAHHGMPQAPRASLWVPGVADILTRPLDKDDHACGNEVVEYPPLSDGVTALPAYTLSHSFKAKTLGTTWSDPNCRSSFVGRFAR